MDKIYGFVSAEIHAGATAAFEQAARACHEAILPDLTGTRCYEWFMSEDGRRAAVIEVYDDPAALALHGRMLDGRVGAVLEQARMQITLAGAAPEALLERMRLKLGAADDAGPRAFGRIDGPTPHRIPTPGDARIYAVAWFRPHAGKAEIFRDLARQSYDRACERDPGTLGYEWFFDGRGDCLAFDIYRDADAMMAHMANCGPIMGQILQVADSRTMVLGALPPQIEARLRPELGITRFPRRLHGIG